MEIITFIEKFKIFLETYYKNDLVKLQNESTSLLDISFQDLKMDLDLSDFFIESPSDFIEFTKSFLDSEYKQVCYFTISNFQEEKYLNKKIGELRQKHIDSLMVVEGQVSVLSEIRPLITSLKFECPNCGNVISTVQLSDKLKEPTRCGCGRKGKFLKIESSKVYEDVQRIVVEEKSDALEGNDQPKRRNCLLKNILTSPQKQKHISPGANIMVIGILREIPLKVDRSGESTEREYVIEVINLEPTEQTFMNLDISEEEMEDINELLELDKEDLQRRLIASYSPDIYGKDMEKLAILLQNVGGCDINFNGIKRRGNLHIAFFGEPGTAKSQLAKYNKNIAPKYRYTSGTGASGVGLTMTAEHDPFLGMYVAKAGVLVLANNGVAILDEFDKIPSEQHGKLNEALEHQEISLNKASIHVTAKTNTSILVCANPKGGTFDTYTTFMKQMDVDRTLMDRFDLIFIFTDTRESEVDKIVANKILDVYTQSENVLPTISNNVLRKYLAFVKKVEPTMTKEAREKIVDVYDSARQNSTKDQLPISPRYVESIVRLSTAYTKLLGKKEITIYEVEQAYELLKYSLKKTGIMNELGTIDTSIVSTGLSSKQRSTINILAEFLEESKPKVVDYEQIKEFMKGFQVSDRELDEMIEKLMKKGEIYEPRRGFYAVM